MVKSCEKIMSVPWNWEPLPHWEHRVLASSRTTHRRALRPPTRWPGQGHFSREFLMVHPSKKWLYMSDNSNMFVLEHNGGHFIIWYVFPDWSLRVQSRQVSLKKSWFWHFAGCGEDWCTKERDWMWDHVRMWNALFVHLKLGDYQSTRLLKQNPMVLAVLIEPNSKVRKWKKKYPDFAKANSFCFKNTKIIYNK